MRLEIFQAVVVVVLAIWLIGVWYGYNLLAYFWNPFLSFGAECVMRVIFLLAHAAEVLTNDGEVAVLQGWLRKSTVLRRKTKLDTEHFKKVFVAGEFICTKPLRRLYGRALEANQVLKPLH